MKYKYYFRKPRSEIVRDILIGAAVGSAILVAATSPYFGINLMKSIAKGRTPEYKKEKVYSTFWRLKKSGCIETKVRNRQIYISLTEKGKRMASWLQIDALKINRPPKWDKKWRVVIFDVNQLKKLLREAFRGKLKELGFVPLQKSVWIHAFECRDEITLLREFLGLSEEDVRLMVVENIGNDQWLRQKFNL